MTYKADYIDHRGDYRIYNPSEEQNTIAYCSREELNDYFTEEETCLLLHGQAISKEAVR